MFAGGEQETGARDALRQGMPIQSRENCQRNAIGEHGVRLINRSRNARETRNIGKQAGFAKTGISRMVLPDYGLGPN